MDRPLRGSTLRVRVLFTILGAALCMLVLAPASALAATPAVFIEEGRPTGATTEEILGEVEPGSESTTYRVAYGLASTKFCQTEGEEGSAEHLTTPQTLPFTDATYHPVSVDLSGLTSGKGYCAELVASNASGTTSEEGQVTFTAGLPGVFAFEATPTGEGTETLEGEVDPAGQTTQYHAAYGLASTEWCTTGGSKGSAEHSTTPQTLGFTNSTFHVVSVDVSGLTGGKPYCFELIAKDPSGTEHSEQQTFTPGVPTVTTDLEPTPTGASTETVAGEINPVGQTTEYHAAYGLASSEWCTSGGSKGSAEHSTTTQTLSSTNPAEHEVSVELGGLTGGKAYCAELVATNPSATTDGNQVSFTVGIPRVSAFDATPTGVSTETIGGEVDPVAQSTEYHVAYGPSSSEWCTSGATKGAAEHSTTAQTLPSSDGATYHSVSVELSGLTGGTAYCAQLIAVNASGTADGGQVAFTAGIPGVFTFEVTPTGAGTETIGGEVNPAGQSTEYHAAYGLASSEWCTTDGNQGSAEHSTTPQTLAFTDTAYHPVSVDLTGLTADQAYCAELIAKNAAGTAQSRATFTSGVPGVVTVGSTSTGESTEKINGEVDPVGQSTQYHVAYGLSGSAWCTSSGASGTPEQTTTPQTLSATDATFHDVSVELSGLSSGSAYCAELIATNGSGTTEGEQVAFTAGVPGVQAVTAAPTAATSETIGGEVDPQAQEAKYHVGYGLAKSRWCTSGGISGAPEQTTTVQTLPFSDAAYHAVSVEVSALTQGSEYCAELIASNTAGSTESGVVSFTAGAPLVSTSEALSTGTTSGEVLGEVDPAGQTTEYHVAYGLASSEWCTSGAITGAAEHSTPAQTLPFTDTASHSVAIDLSALSAQSSYCAELIAKNASAPVAGGQLSFTTAAAPTPPVVTPEVPSGGGTGSGSSTGTSSTSGTSTPTTVTPPSGTVSLAGSTLAVQSNGRQAAIKLTCTGTGACAGKLTLTVTVTMKKGKKKHTATETLATASFSIRAGATVTVKLSLSAAGRALLGAAHGRLAASLTILKSSPSPSAKQTRSVHLVQQKAAKSKHKK
jgi:hypothetical protein